MSSFRKSDWTSFLIALVATLLLWVGSAMSERKSYPTTFRLQYVGYDTARYVLLAPDSTVTLGLSCNGFGTLYYSVAFRQKCLTVPVAVPSSAVAGGEAVQLRVSVAEQLSSFASQLGGKLTVQPISENIIFSVAQRRCRAYVPELHGVSFSFRQGYCVAGDPIVEPDSVYLYGSAESLRKVDALFTSEALVVNVGGGTQSFELALDTSWSRYGDLRISTPTIKVVVPTIRCTEKTLDVPVKVLAADSATRVRLYPEMVQVSVWVPVDDYDVVVPEQFEAVVRLQDDPGDAQLPVLVQQFPSKVRVKSVQPSSVQYLMLRK